MKKAYRIGSYCDCGYGSQPGRVWRENREYRGS